MAEKKKGDGKLRIKQIRSSNGRPRKHRATLEALGVKYQRSVVQPDNAAIRGMIFQVSHMLEVEELEGEE